MVGASVVECKLCHAGRVVCFYNWISGKQIFVSKDARNFYLGPTPLACCSRRILQDSYLPAGVQAPAPPGFVKNTFAWIEPHNLPSGMRAAHWATLLL